MLLITYQASAAKAMKRLDPVWRRRIVDKLNDYAVAPASLANAVKRLQGDRRLRLRVGMYRVIFTEDGVVLVVQEVGHRGEVYRRLS